MNTRFFTTGVLILSTLVPTSFLALPTTAVELTNGETAFESSPRLLRATTTFNERRVESAKYYFTIEVPEDAGKPLKAVKIEQRNNVGTIEFKVNESRAALRESFRGGQELSLVLIGGVSKPGEVTVVFERPVEPGNTVTIALKPKRNPFQGGVYLFGVTVFPEGEDSSGLYLGSGRLHFYD
ncbi:hypothetical protein BJP34_01760 [Moorena producens PAL-8-15-08-1]|uniref:DUF2808 domain-containing protein n=1 Tax=Moorena producens PAL-8-15-08-1 TaxID=1458985 RepID=A0A1D8U2I4_9CYAN|nr:hypothetical protein BJP34_01760 [Moorena producens PAL-8-15-08-1]